MGSSNDRNDKKKIDETNDPGKSGPENSKDRNAGAKRMPAAVEGDAGYADVRQQVDDHSSHDRTSIDASSKDTIIDDHSIRHDHRDDHSIRHDHKDDHSRRYEKRIDRSKRKQVTRTTKIGDTVAKGGTQIKHVGTKVGYVVLLSVVAIIAIVAVVYILQRPSPEHSNQIAKPTVQPLPRLDDQNAEQQKLPPGNKAAILDQKETDTDQKMQPGPKNVAKQEPKNQVGKSTPPVRLKSQGISASKPLPIGSEKQKVSTEKTSAGSDKLAAVKKQPPPSAMTGSRGLFLSCLYRPGGDGPILPLREGSVLSSGDHYKIFFRSENQGHIYIFQVDSTGHIYKLFPMVRFGSVILNNINPVQQGMLYAIPAADKSFTLDQNTGEERIYVVFTDKPNARLEGLGRKLDKARSAKDSSRIASAEDDLKRYMRKTGLADVVTDRPVTINWGSGSAAFQATADYIRSSGENELHVIKFHHN